MREIKFRGKRIDNEEWVCGDIVHHDGITDIHYQTGDAVAHFIPVDPEKYTGLSDKNGKEIYEGDILNGFKYPYLSGGNHNYMAEVVLFEDSPAFGIRTIVSKNSKVRGISDGNEDYMIDWNPNDWEVIGNIHDNPELMEEDNGRS